MSRNNRWPFYGQDVVQCRLRDLVLLSICIFAIFLWIEGYTWNHSVYLPPSDRSAEVLERHGLNEPIDPANATLGFGGIIAVSTRNSYRQKFLQLSAEITGLQIDIPDQPLWTKEDVENLKAKSWSRIRNGSVLAWLGHLNALRWFMEQSYETALLIEDDLNWDIHLRGRQIPLAARAFHSLIENTTEMDHHDGRSSNASQYSFWPSTIAWDLLYLGHCGDFFPANRLHNTAYTTYADPNMPAFQGLQSEMQRFLEKLSVSERHRMIHRSQRPLCTFAYAVSKSAAARILKDYSHEAEGGGTEAYDVRIKDACRSNELLCWTLSPELLHHTDDELSEIRVWEKRPFRYTSWEARAAAKARGTPNIGCGIKSIVRRLGAGERVRSVVNATKDVDGLCPVPMDEIDEMRGQIIL